MLSVLGGSNLTTVADWRSLHLRLRETRTAFSLSGKIKNEIMSDFEEFEKQLSENRRGENSCAIMRC